MRQAEAAAREAERNYTRQRSLLESGASSQRTVDAALTAHEHAAANLAASKAALSLATAGFRDEDIAAGEARVAVAARRIHAEDSRDRGPADRPGLPPAYRGHRC